MSDSGGVVGRDRELATVTAFLDALPSGTSCLLLEGAAGIGKTTIWEAGVAGAAARSYLTLSSRPAESEATLSFAALGDLMDGVLGQVLPQLPVPQRRALEVALLMEDPVGSPPEQRAVCLAFLGVIRHLSASAPVVIAIDDLQWLDRPSAAALEFALRRLGSEPVGLLASVRIQAGGHAASAAGAGLPAGRLARLQVGPLTVPAFEAALRASAGAGLSRLTLRRLFDASGGNPFYGLELARALDRVGGEPLPGEPLPVPADLRGVLSARLGVLPERCPGCPAGGLVPAVADDHDARTGGWPGGQVRPPGGCLGGRGGVGGYPDPVHSPLAFLGDLLGGAARPAPACAPAAEPGRPERGGTSPASRAVGGGARRGRRRRPGRGGAGGRRSRRSSRRGGPGRAGRRAYPI